MNKKIVFVTHLYYPARGGVEHHIKNLSEKLVERGYRVKVLTTNAYSTEAFFLGDKRRTDENAAVINGVEVDRLGFYTSGKTLLNRLRETACRFPFPFNDWIRFYSFGPRNRRFVAKVIEFEPDIIFAAPLPTLNTLYAYKAAKKLRKPLIVIPSVHILDPCSFDNRIFFRIMREAACVMVQSHAEKDYLIERGHVDEKKFVVLPPLPLTEDDLARKRADRTEKKRLRDHLGISEQEVVLSVGQHGAHKNTQHVLDAMGIVWRRRRDVALVIAGGTTAFTKKLKKRALELEEQVNGKTYFFDDFPPEMKDDIYRSGDIFLSLSEFESFGIVFAEALNHGLPVVASRRCVASEYLTDLENASLVDPHQSNEVAGALLELLEEEDTKEYYSAHAEREAKVAFDPERIVDQWEGIFERIGHR